MTNKSFDALDAQSISTGADNFALSDQNDQDITLYLDPNNGSDSNPGTQADPLATIQEAWESIPHFVEGAVTIDLTTVPSLPVSYNEDLYLYPKTGHSDILPFATGEYGAGLIEILGDRSTPSNVKLNSLYAVGMRGTGIPTVHGVEIQNESPFSNANAGIQFLNCYSPVVRDCSFSSNTTFDKGVLMFDGNMTINPVDVTNCDSGIVTKGTGFTQVRDLSGSANNNAIVAQSATEVFSRVNPFDYGGPTTANGGLIYYDNGSTLVQTGHGAFIGSRKFFQGFSPANGYGLLGLPNHHINYASGLTTEELARVDLIPGEALELWKLEAQLKGGGTNNNVTLDVYDASTATVLGSVTGGSRSAGGNDPIATSSDGATILLRLSTGGSAVDLCASGITSVVPS